MKKVTTLLLFTLWGQIAFGAPENHFNTRALRIADQIEVDIALKAVEMKA